jgi:hypothetical protein
MLRNLQWEGKFQRGWIAPKEMRLTLTPERRNPRRADHVLAAAPSDMPTSRAAGVLAVLVNLAAFSVCACLAFARNIHALFYHYDGAYALVDVRNQLSSVHPIFEFSNDFLQSIGNIQFLHNARLLFFFWPIGWLSDLQAAKIGTYLIIALIVFLSAYALGRLLSQSRAVALTAGWILGFVTTPFAPLPFFYPILNVAPGFALVIVAPVAVFWLILGAGRSGALSDIVSLSGLIALTFYILAASPSAALLIAPGAAGYVVLAFVLARRRSELLRKLIVLAAALLAMIALRWPWYMLGLFSDTAPYVFSTDFTTVYSSSSYASILFHGRVFGWAGPTLAVLAAAGALASVTFAAGELRAAAWALLIWLLAFVGATLALFLTSNWIWPPPIYVEAAIWPLYGVFAAVAVHRVAKFVVTPFPRTKTWKEYRPAFNLALLIPMGLIATFVAVDRPATEIGYPFPPMETPIVDILRRSISLHPRGDFNGRIATIVPVKPDAGDAWGQQSLVTTIWAQSAGNDEMSLGLWYYHVPTLFEYNQLASPEFHALIKRALQRPPVAHQRNVTVFTYPDARVLKLLGVRYMLMPQPIDPIGEVRATEERAGQRWDLIELREPNLATYSPTAIETRRDLASMIDFVVDENTDLTKRAVVSEEVAGALTPLRSSALSMADGDLHIVAESVGRSLVVVPVEFSNCLSIRQAQPGAARGGTLLRVDGMLSGIVFEHKLDAVLSFRIGPLSNPLCRWRDYQEIKAVL